MAHAVWLPYYPLVSVISRPAANSDHTLSLHDALPILERGVDHVVRQPPPVGEARVVAVQDAQPLRLRGGLDRRVEAQHLRQRGRSEEHTSELQSRENLVCRLLLEKKTRSSDTGIYALT